MVTASGAIAQSFLGPHGSGQPLEDPEGVSLGSISSAGQLIGMQSRRSRTIKRAGDIVFSLAALSLGHRCFWPLVCW